MTQRAALLVVAGCFALMCSSALVGCPPKQPQPENPETQAPGTDAAGVADAGTGTAPGGRPIKIGAIFSVTGLDAPLGKPEQDVVEMIKEQLSSDGGVLGRPIEIILKDDGTQEARAVTAARDLIETHKVCAIIGPSATSTTMAIKGICEKAGVPLISCAAGRAITDPIARWVFAVPQTDALAVAKILDNLIALKIKRVAILYVANQFGESGRKQLEKQLKPAGVKITAGESFGPTETDMTAPVTRIKAAKPDAVICWGTNPGPASVATAMRKLGMTVPLIQSHGVANKTFLELAGDAAEGVMLPAGRLIVWEAIADDHPQQAVLKDFATAYKQRTQQEADTFAGHAYDALHILLQAIETAGGDDKARIRDAIETTRDFVGTAGVFNYSATDHNGLTKDAFVWVTVDKGGWTLAE